MAPLRRSLGIACTALALLTAGSCAGARLKTVETAKPAKAPGPRTVLMLGDSVMWDAEPGVEAALHAAGVPVVWRGSIRGMGLTRTVEYDWRTQWPATVAEHQPDAVVVQLGAWDVIAPVLDGRQVEAGTPEWQTWFRPMVDQAMTDLTATGAQVWWISVLPYDIPGSAPRTTAINAELAGGADRHPGVHFVDAVPAFSRPGGGFSAWLRGPAHHLQKVRKDDGVHLCAPGAELLADVLLGQMGQSVTAPWTTGLWRDDLRYHETRVGAGCDGLGLAQL